LDKSPDAFRTISEVAEDLDLPQHVLRFWETRFNQIRPLKRGGGRRYYRPDDVELLKGIRHLLYGQGYTIRGVQRILKEQGVKTVQALGRGEVSVPPPPGGPVARPPEADYSAPDDADFGEDDVGYERAEPRLPASASPAGARGPSISDEALMRLRAALAELVECRRLIDVARTSPSADAG
jgi:DNA-binding transcriptional MerR regulator